jgi:hypothetical protein
MVTGAEGSMGRQAAKGLALKVRSNKSMISRAVFKTISG